MPQVSNCGQGRKVNQRIEINFWALQTPSKTFFVISLFLPFLTFL